MVATTVAQAQMMLEEGHSIRNTASTLNLPYTTVRDAIARYRETGSFNRRPGSGRPRATSERDDRFIVSSVLRNRHITSVEVRQRLQEVRNVRVCAQTIRNRLKQKKTKFTSTCSSTTFEPTPSQKTITFCEESPAMDN